MMAQTQLILEDMQTGRCCQIGQARVTIGKGTDNDLVIAGDRRISRDHAIIERTESGWYQLGLEDRHPLYPPHVNGEPITAESGARILETGDIIQIGHHYFKIGYGTNTD